MSKDDVCKCAVKRFGTTNDFMKAGFIMPNGEMIDLSFGKEKRQVEHDIIGECIDNRTDYGRMQWMKRCGAVRLSYPHPEQEGGKVRVEAVEKPTEKQTQRIIEATTRTDSFYGLANRCPDKLFNKSMLFYNEGDYREPEERDEECLCEFNKDFPVNPVDVRKWVKKCWR